MPRAACASNQTSPNLTSFEETAGEACLFSAHSPKPRKVVAHQSDSCGRDHAISRHSPKSRHAPWHLPRMELLERDFENFGLRHVLVILLVASAGTHFKFKFQVSRRPDNFYQNVCFGHAGGTLKFSSNPESDKVSRQE